MSMLIRHVKLLNVLILGQCSAQQFNTGRIKLKLAVKRNRGDLAMLHGVYQSVANQFVNERCGLWSGWVSAIL